MSPHDMLPSPSQLWTRQASGQEVPAIVLITHTMRYWILLLRSAQCLTMFVHNAITLCSPDPQWRSKIPGF